MFRALYRQIARFLNWVNRTGSGPSASSRAIREAEDHRRDIENRSGSSGGGLASKGRAAHRPWGLDFTPTIEELGRRRLIELAGWREILVHGTNEERRKLAAKLREVDFEPLFRTLDEDEAEVRTTASHQRQVLALNELRRMSQQAIIDGDLEHAAQWLDLRLSVEDPRMRD